MSLVGTILICTKTCAKQHKYTMNSSKVDWSFVEKRKITFICEPKVVMIHIIRKHKSLN